MHIVIWTGVLGLSMGTLTVLLSRFGYLAVFGFVGIESSGIPFPGETMLVTGAIYAGSGHLSIVGVALAGALGAIVGDNLGYLAGRSGGHALVARYGRYLHIREEHLHRAEGYFERYGDRTVFFGRFVAVLRAWSAFLAGVNRMPWPKFLLFNAAGGILWSILYSALGYTLGNNLPLLHRVERIIGVAGVAAAVLVAVVLLVVWRRRRAQRRSMRTPRITGEQPSAGS